MQTYKKYKDSGVEWIGKIPEHWNVVSLKRSLRIKNGCDYKTIQVDEDGFPVIGSGGEFARASKYLYDGEVVLLGRKGTIDKPLYYEGKFWVVDTMFYGIPLKNCFGKYLYFQSITIPFNRYSTNTALPSMTQTDLNSHSICLPTFAEQQAIASYLDKKCADIDKVIATQQRRIELLQELKQSTITHAVTRGLNPNVKMKDSGVEWIGEVPEHWEIMKIKNFCKVNGRIGYRGYTTADLVQDGNGAYTIGGKHITDCKLDLSNADFISWNKYYESPEIMVKKGNIVLAQRGSLGKFALIDKEIGEATINPSLVLLNSLTINANYMNYYLFSNNFQTDVLLLNTATAVPMISQNQIENIKQCFPPLDEQQSIATYLDKKCAELDNSISKTQKEIGLLQEYKQALITEVVTGKRKVC